MYYSLWKMLEMVDHSVNRKPCMKLLKENEVLFKTVQGSTHNHQAWKGGYWDHIQEVMNIAIVLYKPLDELRAHHFTLGEALLVLFLHDAEKPWKYEQTPDGLRHKKYFVTKGDSHGYRMSVIAKYNIQISSQQENAIKYVEGEHNDYTNQRRVMNELAMFCHMCDGWSARGWHNRPLEKNETWGSRQFSARAGSALAENCLEIGRAD